MGGIRLFFLAFLLLGMWCLALGTIKATEGLKARSWPKAKGRVISSRIQEMKTQQKIRIARLCFDIDYLYLVGDEVYDGHRVNVGWRCFGSESKINEMARRYPSGRQVDVYYNPQNPSISMLEPGLDWSVFFLWGVGLVSLSVAWPFFRRGRGSFATSDRYSKTGTV